MKIDANFLDKWKTKGHRFGECMSTPTNDLMYVHIPKNASSWTKPNLQDWGWEFYNYHHDNLNKHAMVVLRDPVERWISGMAEYMTLYHPTITLEGDVLKLIFDRITFDDHTESQVKFIHGLDTDNCTFFWCDENYRKSFSQFVTTALGPNKYYRYAYQYTAKQNPKKQWIVDLLSTILQENAKCQWQVKSHFEADYKLIDQVKFYVTK